MEAAFDTLVLAAILMQSSAPPCAAYSCTMTALPIEHVQSMLSVPLYPSSFPFSFSTTRARASASFTHPSAR